MIGRNLSKAAVLFCGLCIGVAIMLATTCGSKPTVNDRSARIRHYPDLEKVSVKASLPSFEKDYEGFTLSFNPVNRVPNWVGWELLDSEANGETARSNRFWKDESVDGCAHPSDYKGSGYDRGHLCPAADQKWSKTAMKDCFALTNIAPQDHALNSGAWNTLEAKERMWAQRDSAIVIVAGPIYNSSKKKFIGEGVRVPDAFFKVILAPYVESPRAIGFVYPNMPVSGNMQNYVMTVDDIEALTGYDFFYNLPDSIEDQVEKTASFREWMEW